MLLLLLPWLLLLVAVLGPLVELASCNLRYLATRTPLPSVL